MDEIAFDVDFGTAFVMVCRIPSSPSKYLYYLLRQIHQALIAPSRVKARGLLVRFHQDSFHVSYKPPGQAYHALWIVDCIKQGQILPMDDYILDGEKVFTSIDV